MKMILKIAKKEWQQLFYSPIAWLLLVAFIVQTSFIFIDRFTSMVYSTVNQGGFRLITNYLFSDIHTSAMRAGTGALWVQVQDFLFLYIPLLTMGIISKEMGNGTIKLMYSSPIRNSQIIMGKYVALIGYAAVMMLPLLGYVMFSWFTVEQLDLAWALSGMLGLYLLACAYMAIGLFVSSLSTHQGIAAIGTFAILTFLGVIGGMWQQYEFVRDFTYWLSIKGRALPFIDGMISSEDVLYFVMICATFLSLTIIRLNAVRQKLPFRMTMLRYLAVVVVLCVAARLTMIPQLMFYCDTTSNQKNTLSPESQEILKQIDEKITLTAYVNILTFNYGGGFEYPSFIIRNREDFQKYLRFKTDIDIKTVYYYAKETPDLNLLFAQEYPDLSERELALKFCTRVGLNPKLVKTKDEIDPEVKQKLAEVGYPTIRELVTESGKRAFYRNPYKIEHPFDEAGISAAFKRLLGNVPQIGFVQGHRERSLDSREPLEYQSVLCGGNEKMALSNHGFDIREITLDQSIPGDIDIVMLVDPREKISVEQEKMLKEYVDRGDNLVILGEPRRCELLNPVLRGLLGAKITPVLVHARKPEMPQSKLMGHFQQDVCRELEMTRLAYGSKMNFQVAGGVEVVEDHGFKQHVIVSTGTKDTLWTELETTDFENEEVVFHADAGERMGIFTPIMGLSREANGKQQKIILAGDADIFDNENKASGSHVLHAFGKWLTDNEYPLHIVRPLLPMSKVNLTPNQFDNVKWIFSIAIPLLLTIAGVALWLRRKAK